MRFYLRHAVSMLLFVVVAFAIENAAWALSAAQTTEEMFEESGVVDVTGGSASGGSGQGATEPVFHHMLAASADTYIREGVATNYGALPFVMTKSPGTASWFGYLKFDTAATAGPITRATLQLTVKDILGIGATGDVGLYEYANTGWNEMTLSGVNGGGASDPAVGVLLGVEHFPKPTGTIWSVDVTDYVNARRTAGVNVVGFTLRSASSVFASGIISSRESAFGPKLILEGVIPPTIDSFISPSRNSTITLTGTKPKYTAVYINGAWAVGPDTATTWSASPTLTVEGENTFSIAVRDAEGRESAAVTVIAVRDTVPPEIIFNHPLSGAWVNQAHLPVEGAVDGAAFTVMAELTEGANVVTKHATDAAGNEAEAGLTLHLDTAAPMLRVTNPPAGTWVTSPDATVAFTRDGVLDSEVVHLDHEGVNTIAISRADQAGNVGTVSHTLRLDSIPPQIVFTSHGEGEAVNSVAELMVFTVDGVEKATEFLLPAEGPNIFSLTEHDEAGNVMTAHLTLIRDTTAPAFSVTFPTDGTLINASQVNK